MTLNITIIGLDTVGSALGLALGTLDPETLATGRPAITGWDADKRRLGDARGRLFIDRAASDPADAVHDADVVFASVPVHDLEATFNAIAPHVKHGAVISDVGSAKGEAVAIARRALPTTVDFISGHPILLGHDTSPTQPSIEFFRGALYCLVTTPTTRANAINVLDALVAAIGAKPYYIDADEHDAYIAGVEQLPVLLAMALMETLSRSGGWREMQPIAGGAFRSATALAARDPEQIRAACMANAQATERWINDLLRVLVDIRDNLHHGEQLEALLQHAHDAHRQWSAVQPNVRPGEGDLGVPTETQSFGLRSLFLGRRQGRDKK